MIDFILGKEAAIVKIAELIEEGNSFEECFNIVEDSLRIPELKIASEEDTKGRLGFETVAMSFLKEATAYLGSGQGEGKSEEDALLFVFEKVAMTESEADNIGKGMADGVDTETMKDKAKAKLRMASEWLRENKVKAGVGGALALSAIGGGAYALHRKSKKDSLEKSASLEIDTNIDEAINELEKAGFLND